MENYIGKTLDIILPSGAKVTIREQNGNDDDILSNVEDANRGVSLAKFVADIITKDHRLNRPPTYNEVLKWKMNDMYYVMFMSRIHSLSENLEFELTCINSACKKITRFEENLNIFTHDFTKPIIPKKIDDGKGNMIENPEYFKYRIHPYPSQDAKDKLFTLSTGKVLQFEYLTVEGEHTYANATSDKMSRNKKLIARNIKLKLDDRDDGQWMPIANFGIFSPKEMSEIWKVITEEDVEWIPIMECICPVCNAQQNVVVIWQPDFFFPLGK